MSDAPRTGASEDFGRGRVEALSDGGVGAGVAWVSGVAAFVCYGVIALYFVFPRSLSAQR